MAESFDKAMTSSRLRQRGIGRYSSLSLKQSTIFSITSGAFFTVVRTHSIDQEPHIHSSLFDKVLNFYHIRIRFFDASTVVPSVYQFKRFLA